MGRDWTHSAIDRFAYSETHAHDLARESSRQEPGTAFVAVARQDGRYGVVRQRDVLADEWFGAVFGGVHEALTALAVYAYGREA